LWKAYKDLTQRAASVADSNIGFLFASNKDFAKGLIEFQTNYPAVRPELGKSLEETRAKWQNELATFRNTLEHQDTDPEQFMKFYESDYIEWLFLEVWNTIVDLMSVLLESRLAGGTKLGLPDLEKYPNLNNRFMFYNPGFAE